MGCHQKSWVLQKRLWLVFSGHDGHQGALTSIACNKEGTLALTGSVDGQAKLINTSTGKVRRVTAVPTSVFLPVTMHCCFYVLFNRSGKHVTGVSQCCRTQKCFRREFLCSVIKTLITVLHFSLCSLWILCYTLNALLPFPPNTLAIYQKSNVHTVTCQICIYLYYDWAWSEIWTFPAALWRVSSYSLVLVSKHWTSMRSDVHHLNTIIKLHVWCLKCDLFIFSLGVMLVF